MPAISPYIIKPIWEQFRALLPERKVDHPLGCHPRRMPDQLVFEKLLQILVFGCAYWRIADESCSATTLRRRREEWIEAGVMDNLEQMARQAYDRTIGLDVADMAVDCCITKAPCGEQKAGRSPVDRGKQGIKRSVAVDADGIPLGFATAPANRHDSPLLGQKARVVHRARGTGYRLLGRLLQRDRHRREARPTSVGSLPLGGTSPSPPMTYWRGLLFMNFAFWAFSEVRCQK